MLDEALSKLDDSDRMLVSGLLDLAAAGVGVYRGVLVVEVLSIGAVLGPVAFVGVASLGIVMVVSGLAAMNLEEAQQRSLIGSAARVDESVKSVMSPLAATINWLEGWSEGDQEKGLRVFHFFDPSSRYDTWNESFRGRGFDVLGTALEDFGTLLLKPGQTLSFEQGYLGTVEPSPNPAGGEPEE